MSEENLTAEDIATLNAIGDHWMVRTDNDGVSHGGFRWSPVGEWTEAPDFKANNKCGYGLHGQGPGGFGYAQQGTRFVFCETYGAHISVGGDKIKVHKARILFCNRKAIQALVHVSCANFQGSLDLRGCDLNGVTLPQTVGGSLYLRGCDLKGVTLPQTVGGWLDLSGCDLKGVTLPSGVKVIK